MADLDELQIKITSSSKDAEEAISRLTRGLNDLSDALGKIDASKINSFANAMTKLANIGNNTNTTAKAIKSISNEIASSFGIRTKKGIEDITLALQELYKSARNVNMSNTPENNEAYFKNLQNLQDAIEANFKYKESVDETTKAIHEYVKAQNQSGSKVAMADMAKEYGENFKEVAKVLGKSFNNTLKSTEGALDLVKFFEDMNAALGTTFKVDNDQELKQSLDDLVRILQNAKDKVYDFSEAVASGLLTGEEAANSAYAVADRLFALIKEQDKYGASSGLGGLTEVFREISNMQMPDMTGVAEALRAAQSASGASKGINDIAKSSQKAASDVQELQNALMVVSQNTELMSKNDSTSLTVFEKMLPAVREVSAFQPPDLSTAIKQFNEYADAINRALNGMKAIEDKRLGLPDKYYDPIDTTGEWVENNPPDNFFAVDKFAQMERAAEGARRATDRLGDSIKYIEDQFGRPIDTTGEWVDNTPFKETAENAQKAGEAVKNAKEQMSGSSMADVLEPLIALGEGLEKLAHQFDSIGDKGIRIFQILTTPLKMAAEEYVEKFENMKSTIEGFRKHFQTKMTKLSQFWKRTMKTFTFMLVRKAITAVIEEVGKAVQSLAMYSNAMGTAFNTDVSHMVADFQYLGRSIVSVFAPLLNYIVPIIDAIVDRIATLISYIGMLFAALGGSASFTKAKKNIGNYAESLDQASKSAKNLTMGIDELNILSEQSGGGGAKPYDGWEDAWEEVNIPKWILDLSDLLKDFWKKFFDPLKEAWDRAKQYLIDGFKTMINALRSMFGSIIDDFLTVWNQEKTIRMFEQMLRIVGDLMRVVRQLAHNFEDAWNKGKIGLKILENLRDIAAILVDHIRNVTYYMIGWSKDVKFDSLLEAFEELTHSAKRVADFIGGVFEDVAKTVLDHIEWSIEEGTPHLLETIANIFNAFDFVKLRENLKEVWKAFDEVFKNIHVGTTNAIGNLGNMVARFVNSKEFEDFLNRIVEVSKLITKERVEKVLTGLGKGIISVAKAVVKFVNSDAFMKFLNAIAKWIDNHSVDQIAGVLEKLAIAIGLFKFGAFATEKLAGFFQFASVLLALKNLGTIAKHFASLGEHSAEAAPKITTIAGALEKIKSINIGESISRAASSFLDLHNHIGLFAKGLGTVVTAFAEFKIVEKNVENLALLIGGDDSKSLWGSIVSIGGAITIAGAAFTAFLGFPAGLIATLCVGAVAAIKGISDAVEQLNFEHMTDAIMTQGDTTVQKARDWYSETTEIVSEYTNKWKDIERDLVQDRGDIDEFAKSIEGLNIAIQNNTEITSTMATDLVGKYQDLGNSINNYIDKSTDSIVQSLLAQRAYLESQGESTEKIDRMIADIYKNADAEKNAIAESITNLKDAYKAYEDEVEKSGSTSQEAIRLYGEYVKAASAAGDAVQGYVSDVNAIDTSEGVKQIEALGKSLDLSNYSSDAEGLAVAKQNISTALNEIKEKYSTEMAAVNQTYEDRINELDQYAKEHPWFTEDMYAESKANIETETASAKDTLISATSEALDLYSNSLTDKFADVAKRAEEDWEKQSWWQKTFGPDKQQFVLEQIRSYSDNLLTGEDGLAGQLTSAYKEVYKDLPGNVDPDVESAMKHILENESTFFITNIDGTQTVLANKNKSMLEGVLKAVDEVDYDTPAGIFARDHYNAMYSHFEEMDYDSLGSLWNDKTGGALLNNTQIFDDANRLAANEGAAAFNQSYIDFLKDNTEIITTLEEQGDTYGTGLIDGLNEAIDKKADTTKPFIQEWFKKINDWIHDNSDLPFGSPNKKTEEYGEDVVKGFNLGITTSASTSSSPINGWFSYINTAINNGLSTVKETFATFFNTILSGNGLDVTGSVTTLFTTITESMIENINLFGELLLTTTIPEFIEAYLMPCFELFKTWFSESMTAWWEDGLLPWFDSALWDEDVFTPLKENIQEHWETFSSWWDTTMSEWWENQVKPWFAKDLWKEQLTNILEVTKEVFDLIKEAIKLRMDEAAEAVEEACQNMTKAIEDVMTAVDDMLEKLGSFEGFNGDVTFSFGAKEFAQGGFPSRGSLFWAGETGAGAEMVGSIGGKTGVVSNGEITGIADAVYATGNNESELLAQLISIGQAMLNKDPIVLGDKEIARMANSGQSKLGMSIIS